MLTFYDKTGKPISPYWWRRLVNRGEVYSLLQRTKLPGGVVTTHWIGVAAPWERPPGIFSSTSRIEGLQDVTLFTATENSALVAHGECVSQAKLEQRK